MTIDSVCIRGVFYFLFAILFFVDFIKIMRKMLWLYLTVILGIYQNILDNIGQLANVSAPFIPMEKIQDLCTIPGL